MKKTVIIMCVMLVAVSSLFAAPLLQLGGSTSYSAAQIKEEKTVNAGSFTFGAEARLNPSDWVSFVMPVSARFGSDKTLFMSPSANINIPVSATVDIAGGMGLDTVLYDGGFLGEGSWKENVKAMEMFYRLALSVNVGRLTLSLAGEIPLENNIGEMLDDISFSPDLGGTTLRMSALFNFN